MTLVSLARGRGRTIMASTAALLIAGACADSTSPTGAIAARDRASLTTGLEVIHGPERFTRTKGAPNTFTRTISTSGFEAPFVLTVQNGDANGANRVSSATVSVDGAVVLGPGDFNQGASSFAVPIAPGATVQLSVTLAGAPGGYLDITLEGKRAGILFCPAGGADSYPTMEGALEAVEPGGTILVCDGEHNIDSVVISKPVTIRSQHSGMATIGDTDDTPGGQGGNRPAFYVDGVASGLVRIADLNFAIYGSVMLAGRSSTVPGTWDRIEFDSVAIRGRIPASTVAFAIRTFPSTVPGARLDVRRSRFDDLAIGVFAVSEEVNVSESVFDTFTSGSVTYSFASGGDATTVGHGVAENNVMRGCGIAGCIRIVGGNSITIRGNTIEAPAGPARLGGIVATTNAPGGASIIIENNNITGARIPSTPADITGWTLQRGVFTNSPAAGYNFIVRGNTISGAFIGANHGVAPGSSVETHDNLISSAFHAFQHMNQGSLVFTRNDATDLLGSFLAPAVALGDYRCNWWGTPAGPNSPPPAVPASRYTPSASAPIAGTSLACDPDSP